MTAKEEIKKFKEEFASLRNKSEEEKKEFDARFRNFIRSKSPEEKKQLASVFAESAKEETIKAKNLINCVNIRLKLDGILDVVSMSYIAETYFNKSRSWFIQRLNNNSVNGVQVSFSEDELNILSRALDEISTKIKNAAQSIAC
jgi:hypothetical protein